MTTPTTTISITTWMNRLHGLSQIDALVQIGQMSNGIIRVSEARRILIGCRLAKGNPKWVGSLLYKTLKRRDDLFIHVEPGIFRLRTDCNHD